MRGRSPSETFSTIWEQGFAARVGLRMDREIQNVRTRVTPDACPRPRDVIQLDRRVTADGRTNSQQISQGSAYEIINRLGFHTVCSRWLPRQLTLSHKQTRLDICQQHLDRLLRKNHHC
jgi:hypothetical protein